MNVGIISLITQSISTSIVNLLIFLFLKNAYGTKNYRRIIYIGAYFISTILMLGINQFEIISLNAIYSYTSFNLICIWLFDAKLKNIWLYNSLYWFLLASCDAITVNIWSVINDTSLEKSLEDYQLMICSNLFNILLMFAVYMICITAIKKVEVHAIQWKLALFMTTMIFFEIFIVVSFASEISSRAGGIKLIFILVGLIVTNVFLSNVISQVSTAYRYRYELSLAERLREMQLANYKEIEKKYSESRAIIHDIKKHIMVIDDLKTDEYTQSVYNRLDEVFCGFRCSSRILSVVMSHKISCAKSEKIDVSLNVDDIQLDFIDDLDITAIFANLWDNAIEACRKLTNEKYIKMKMGIVNNYIFVSMENSCDGNLLPDGKYFLSTKDNHKGMGISSIKMSVEKYNGYFSMESFGNFFRSNITIPIR